MRLPKIAGRGARAMAPFSYEASLLREPHATLASRGRGRPTSSARCARARTENHARMKKLPKRNRPTASRRERGPSTEQLMEVAVRHMMRTLEEARREQEELNRSVSLSGRKAYAGLAIILPSP